MVSYARAALTLFSALRAAIYGGPNAAKEGWAGNNNF
jgi:hypothetical protein